LEARSLREDGEARKAGPQHHEQRTYEQQRVTGELGGWALHHLSDVGLVRGWGRVRVRVRGRGRIRARVTARVTARARVRVSQPSAAAGWA
jgi:hypothetical protein